MSTLHTCDELGVCQSHGCPDCDAWECELPCSPEPARPTYPFAPGVIEGGQDSRWHGLGDDGALLTRRENFGVLLLVLLIALLGTVLGGALAGYLHVPGWIYQVLPG